MTAILRATANIDVVHQPGKSLDDVSDSKKQLLYEKAVRFAFKTYFEKAKEYLSNSGTTYSSQPEIQKWISGQNQSTDDVLKKIANNILNNNETSALNNEIASWYIEYISNTLEVDYAKNTVNYTVEIEIDEENFRNYVTAKKLYVQQELSPPPVPEIIADWWNRPAATPWTAEEYYQPAESKQLFYNIVLLATHPESGGIITSLKEFSGDTWAIDEIKKTASKEGYKLIAEYYNKKEPGEYTGEYGDWTDAHVPESFADGIHLRIRPQPPHSQESLDRVLVRVRILKKDIDNLQSKTIEVKGLKDVNNAHEISRVTYLPAKYFKKDLDFLCANSEKGVLHFYHKQIEAAEDINLKPALDLEETAKLLNTFYNKFKKLIDVAKLPKELNAKKIFNRRSKYAFEFTFDDEYRIISIRLLKSKRGKTFDFKSEVLKEGVVDHIDKSWILAENLWDDPDKILSYKRASHKIALYNSEVIKSSECMSLLYNLRHMIYGTKGFSKKTVAKTPWRTFIDKNIYPQRSIVSEPPTTKDPKKVLEKAGANTAVIRQQSEAREQNAAVTQLTWKRNYLNFRRDWHSAVDDLYSSQATRDPKDLDTLGDVYQRILHRIDIRQYAAKLVACLWPENILQILCEAALNKLGIDSIIQSLFATEMPPGSGKTFFDYAGSFDEEFQETIGAIEDAKVQQDTSVKAAQLDMEVYEKELNLQEEKYAITLLQLNELSMFESWGNLTSEQETEKKELEKMLNKLKGSSSDGPDAVGPNENSITYLEIKLSGAEADKMAADSAWNQSIGSTIPPEQLGGAANIEQKFMSSIATLQDPEIKRIICEGIIGLIPEFLDLLEKMTKGELEFSYKKFVKVLMPKKPTWPARPKYPTDDILWAFAQLIKRALLELITAAIIGIVSGLLQDLIKYCEEGMKALAEALGLNPEDESSENDLPGAQQLSDLLDQEAKRLNSARKLFNDFGIETPDVHSDLDPLPFIAQTNEKNYKRPTLANFEKFLEDVSAVLTPRELCTLINGIPSEGTLTYIERIIEKGYPEIAMALNTKTKIKSLFRRFGKLIDASFCEEIVNDLNRVQIKYEEVCPPGDPRTSYRDALINDRLTPEQNKDMLDAIKQAQKDVFMKALDVATGNPETMFDNLPEPGMEDCTDENGISQGMQRPIKPEAETYLSELVQDTLFQPILKSFASDVQGFFEYLIPAAWTDDNEVLQASVMAKVLQTALTEEGAPTIIPSMDASAEQQVRPELKAWLLKNNNFGKSKTGMIWGTYEKKDIGGKDLVFAHTQPYVIKSQSEQKDIAEPLKRFYILRLKEGKWVPTYDLKNFLWPSVYQMEGNEAGWSDEWLNFKTWQSAQFSELIDANLLITYTDHHLIQKYFSERAFPFTTRNFLNEFSWQTTDSYFWETDNVKKLSKIFKDSFKTAVSKDCPIPVTTTNLLDIDGIKANAKKRQNELECGTSPGIVDGPGPFELSNLESLVMTLFRVYAVEMVLSNVFMHSKFDFSTILNDAFLDYLLQHVLDDLNIYRDEQATFSHVSLNYPTYPEDIKKAIHDILVNKRYDKINNEWELKQGGETILKDPITEEPYNFDDSDAPGKLHLNEFPDQASIQLVVSENQSRRELRHIMYGELIEVSEKMKQYMVVGSTVDDWFLNKCLYENLDKDIFHRMPSIEGDAGVWFIGDPNEGQGIHQNDLIWNDESPFLFGSKTSNLFGTLDGGRRLGFYLQPYLHVDFTQELKDAIQWGTADGDQETLYGNIWEDEDNRKKYIGYVNIQTWKELWIKITSEKGEFATNWHEKDHRKYFKWKYGLRMVFATEVGSEFKGGIDIWAESPFKKYATPAFSGDFPTGSQKKAYYHKILVKGQGSEVPQTKSDHIFSVPLIDVQIPIDEDHPIDYFSTVESLEEVYPREQLMAMMLEDENYNLLFKQIFNLPELASFIAMQNHYYLSLQPKFKDIFKNTKSNIKSVFYTLLNAHDYKNESEGLKGGFSFPDLGLFGDIMNVVGVVPFDPSKIITMTPIKIIKGIAGLIDPSWKKFPWTPLGMTAWILENFRLPAWWEEDEAAEAEEAGLESPCPETVDSPDYKLVGEE